MAILSAQWSLYGLLLRNLQDAYGYTGIGFAQPSLLASFITISALIPVAVLLPSHFAYPSDGALWLLASFVVTPTLAVAVMNPHFDSSVAARAASVVIIGFLAATLLTKSRGVTRRVRQARLITTSDFVAAVAAVALLAIATIAFGFEVTSLKLTLSTATERRLAARGATPPYPGAFYLVNWLKAVLVPLLLLLSIRRRIPLLAGLSLLGMLMVFSFTGEKAAFVYPLIALLLLFSGWRTNVGDRKPWLGVMLTAVIGLPILLSSMVPSSNLDVLISRRFGLVPAQLTHSYVEYTDLYGFTWYAQSLRSFVGYVDNSSSLGWRVGGWLDPDGVLNANANLWADGYGSAGFLGVGVAAVLLAIVLRSFDSLAMSRDRPLAGAVLGTVCFTYVNGYFHTSLLTGGILFAALLVWIMPVDLSSPRHGTTVSPPVSLRGPRL